MHKLPQDRETLQEIKDPDSHVLLRVHAGNFRRLERLLRHDEVCGVISGTAGAEPVMEDFTPVSIPWTPNAMGLLEVDQAVLKRLLAPFPSAIGYFRCVRQATVEISAEDQRLMKLIFGDSGGLLVLIQSAMLRVNILHVYTRQNDLELRLLCRFPIYDPDVDPLVVSAPPKATRDPETGAPPQPAPPAGPKASEKAAPRPAPASTARKSARPALILVGVVASLGALALALFEFGPRRRAPNQPSAPAEIPPVESTPAGSTVQATSLPVELTLRRVGRSVELSWSPTSPAVRNSTRGSLTIFDDNTEKTVNLTRGQVRWGHYWYRPKSGDLLFQLVLYESDDTFAIGTVVGDGNSPAPVTDERTSAPKADLPPAPRVSSTSRDGSVAPTAPPAADTQPQASPAASPVVTPPPAVNVPQSNEPSAASPLSSAGPVSPPPEQAPVSPPTVRREVVPDAPRAVAFVGPVPVRRATPSVPTDVRSRLRSPVAVRVMVHVDPKGNVTAAHLLEQEDAPRLVVPYALQAAGLWHFAPARRDGVAVESDTVILFRFGGQ